MKKSHSKPASLDEITDAILERGAGVDPLFAGFIMEDVMFELGATYDQILEAAETLAGGKKTDLDTNRDKG